VCYVDEGAIDHMIDMNEWFNTFEEVLVGKWPIVVANNKKLWVGGMATIEI
jgi:hypothetical protein